MLHRHDLVSLQEPTMFSLFAPAKPARKTQVSLDVLSNVRIASPCDMRWEEMRGDDKRRHCEQCNLHVHNFAAMTGEEINGLLEQHFNADGSKKERLCAMIYRRADGTILTSDCPVGLAAVRAKARRAMVRLATLIGLASVVGAWAQWRVQGERQDKGEIAGAVAWRAPARAPSQLPPMRAFMQWMRGNTAPVTPPLMGKIATTMGDVCVPAPALQPAPEQSEGEPKGPVAPQGVE